MPPKHLRSRVTDAYYDQRAFLVALEFALYRRSESLLKGSASNLYCVAEADGVAWKIGLAVDPPDRLKSLQIGNPRSLVLYAWAPAPVALERFFHYVLRRERITGEWFSGPRTLAIASVIESAQEIGWEMAADGAPIEAADTMHLLTSRVADLAWELAA